MGRLLDSIDPVPFRMNNLTACFLWRSKLPFAFPTDRECIGMGVQTCWQPNFERQRIAVIPNTLELTDLWVSPALVEEARTWPHLEVQGPARLLPFDSQGNLVQETLFPHSVRGRRNLGFSSRARGQASSALSREARSRPRGNHPIPRTRIARMCAERCGSQHAGLLRARV